MTLNANLLNTAKSLTSFTTCVNLRQGRRNWFCCTFYYRFSYHAYIKKDKQTHNFPFHLVWKQDRFLSWRVGFQARLRHSLLSGWQLFHAANDYLAHLRSPLKDEWTYIELLGLYHLNDRAVLEVPRLLVFIGFTASNHVFPQISFTRCFFPRDGVMPISVSDILDLFQGKQRACQISKFKATKRAISLLEGSDCIL